MGIRAVIFDLDGVIADSEPLSAKAGDIVLERHGIVKTEKEKRDAFGRRTVDIFADIIRDRKARLTPEQLVREKDTVFAGLINGKLRPIKGSVSLVRFLEKKGFLLALATSSHLEKMDAELSALGIGGLFRTRITGDHVRKGKPDPEIYLKAAAALGVPPAECAVVEDSRFGVESAKRAGMFAIGFRSRNSAGQDLSEADMVVDGLSEVRKFFEGGSTSRHGR